MITDRVTWEKRKGNSLSFYENKLPYKEREFNHTFPLLPCIGELVGSKSIVRIADIGAGMFSSIGSIWPTAEVHIYASDILADDYNIILDSKNIKSCIPVEKQDMSSLTYTNDFFDIIVCINALDHCFDPYKAILEMIRVCKIGGWIYLKHFIDNAEYERYSGFHAWNIRPMLDKCLIWSKGARLLLPAGFDSAQEIDSFSGREMVVSKWYKHV
jgi:SAM-dependent methyltransferase